MSRREYYSTALAQAQGIHSEVLSLFDAWNEGMSGQELLSLAHSENILGIDSERRMRNIVQEGFNSRFLRDPYGEAAASLKRLFKNDNPALSLQINLLYAIRQHGIFYDFLVQCYWIHAKAGGLFLTNEHVYTLIDTGIFNGRLKKPWSDSVRKRVSSYVLGIASDFNFVTKKREIIAWMPLDELVLYLVYDLHFLGYSDAEVMVTDEWKALGISRNDLTNYLHRLQTKHHLIIQDTGTFCRIDWKYTTREELTDALIN